MLRNGSPEPVDNVDNRERAIRELYREAQGMFAPAKPGTPAATTREILVEKHVQEGLLLKGYDNRQELPEQVAALSLR